MSIRYNYQEDQPVLANAEISKMLGMVHSRRLYPNAVLSTDSLEDVVDTWKLSRVKVLRDELLKTRLRYLTELATYIGKRIYAIYNNPLASTKGGTEDITSMERTYSNKTKGVKRIYDMGLTVLYTESTEDGIIGYNVDLEGILKNIYWISYGNANFKKLNWIDYFDSAQLLSIPFFKFLLENHSRNIDDHIDSRTMFNASVTRHTTMALIEDIPDNLKSIINRFGKETNNIFSNQSRMITELIGSLGDNKDYQKVIAREFQPDGCYNSIRDCLRDADFVTEAQFFEEYLKLPDATRAVVIGGVREDTLYYAIPPNNLVGRRRWEGYAIIEVHARQYFRGIAWLERSSDEVSIADLKFETWDRNTPVFVLEDNS